MTNLPIHNSAICLGCSKDHVEATNAAIFDFICGGKRMGFADLFFIVIALSIMEHPIEHLKE